MPLVVVDYHKQIRDAMIATLAPLGIGVGVKAVDSPDDMFHLEMPVIAAACVGPEQRRPEFGSNAETGKGYPVAIALLTGGTTRGEKAPGVLTATEFRRLIVTSFEDRRLTGVMRVSYMEVSDAGGEIWDQKNPHFQKLETAMVVTALGRFPRS